MAVNTLTPLIPAFIGNFVDVLREFAPLNTVSTGFGENSVPLGNSVLVPYSAPVVGQNIVPGAVVSDPAGVTVTNASITLTKNRKYPFAITGDDQLRAASLGADFKNLQIKQAVRALVNDVWADVAALNIFASEAVGTPGTSPFGSDVSLAAGARKALQDSLAPAADRFLVYDSYAEQNLLKLPQYLNQYQSGSDQTLQEGKIGKLYGFSPFLGTAIPTSVKGTGTAYVTSGVQAAGSTSIVLATGNGTVVAGDLVQFAGDTTIYVVKTGIAAPGTIVLNQRTQDGLGLRVQIASGAAMTILGNATRNLAFHKSAIGLAIRPSAVPDGGDAAVDRVLISDPITGLTVAVAMYKGYMQQIFEVQATWGTAAIRTELLKLVLG
jgi:P22 coat protein - gene protein 5